MGASALVVHVSHPTIGGMRPVGLSVSQTHDGRPSRGDSECLLRTAWEGRGPLHPVRGVCEPGGPAPSRTATHEHVRLSGTVCAYAPIARD
jgi:hypothetical protein